MKVSILCTAFNHEPYIAQTLESFIQQKTDFPFEVLVTDDASTDRTCEICAEYAAKYPEIIRHFHQEKNLFSQGIDIFPYLLFKEARGEYYAWCEGDDYWTDLSKLQQQVDFLDRNPDYSGCVHNSWYHFCDGSREDELVIPQKDGDYDIGFETVIRGLHESFHTSSILVRASVINPPPDYYDTAFSYGFTDYAIGLEMALQGKIRFIDKPMSVYRRSSNEEAWSTGYHQNYGKLIHFVRGEIAMMKDLIPHLSEEQIALTEQELLKREYELLYLTGNVKEMVKMPYLALFRKESLSFRLKTMLKILFPAVHQKYRERQGYIE